MAESLVRPPTDEVLLVVRAARAAVHSFLWVRAERATPRGYTVHHLLRNDAVGGASLLDPVGEHRWPVHGVGSISPSAVQHARQHEGPEVVGCPGIPRVHLLVVPDARERCERGVGPTVPED